MNIQTFDKIKEEILLKSNQYLIIFIANVKDKSEVSTDYSSLSVVGDYYTINQFQDITQAIRSNGYELLCYFHENDFINDYINGTFKLYNKEILVINTAKTGINVGRKSLIPAFCELNHIKYFGCDPYIISFAKDKFHWHLLLDNFHLPVCKCWLYHKHNGWLDNKKPPIDIKIIAKLNSESCSMGISDKSITKYTLDYDEYLKKLSLEYNQNIILEEFISGFEVEVPLLISKRNKIVFEPMAIMMNKHYNLEDKIIDYDARVNGTYEFSPFKNFSHSLSEKLVDCVKIVADIMELQGFCRIDFRINDKSEFYITDIATTPFFSRYSSVRACFEAEGYKYEDFFTLLLYSFLDKYDAI